MIYPDWKDGRIGKAYLINLCRATIVGSWRRNCMDLVTTALLLWAWGGT